MIRSPLTIHSQGCLRRHLFRFTTNPQSTVSKRNVTINRYVVNPYWKPPRLRHHVQIPNISRKGHEIPWDKMKMVRVENLETNYIDTHCHLHSTLQDMRDDRQKYEDGTIPISRIDRFVEVFFPKRCTAAVDILGNLDNPYMHEYAVKLPWREGFKYYFTFGAHPRTARAYTDSTHQRILSIMADPRCVAWGECGLDYFRTPPSEWPTQRQAFIRQLKSAVFLGKPILVHSRESDKDTFSILNDHVPPEHKIHMQCFTASRELGVKILAHWPKSSLGVTGAITYTATQHIQDMIADGQLPLERMMLGSRSPFMIPHNIYPWMVKAMPKCKKERYVFSHAGMLPFVAEAVAKYVNQGLKKRNRSLKGEDMAGMNKVLEITRDTAERFFGIGA